GRFSLSFTERLWFTLADLNNYRYKLTGRRPEFYMKKETTVPKAEKTTHIIDPSILREYDIRGTVGNTLKDEDCYFVGRAFGTMVVRQQKGKTVAVGFDGRESSPSFANNIIRGLNECGLDVENIGLGPTPMSYFAMKSRGLDAAVMITGSHSPLS